MFQRFFQDTRARARRFMLRVRLRPKLFRSGAPWKLLGLLAALFAAGPVGAIFAARLDWMSGWGLTDRIDMLAALFAAGALYIATMAGVLALIAFGLAARRPVLDLELSLASAKGERLRAGGHYAMDAKRSEFTIRIINIGMYSGRSPVVEAVLLSAPGCQLVKVATSKLPPWSEVRSILYNFPLFNSALEWRSADDVIHSDGGYLDLPPLSIEGPLVGKNLWLRIKAAADGDSTIKSFQFYVR